MCVYDVYQSSTHQGHNVAVHSTRPPTPAHTCHAPHHARHTRTTHAQQGATSDNHQSAAEAASRAPPAAAAGAGAGAAVAPCPNPRPAKRSRKPVVSMDAGVVPPTTGAVVAAQPPAPAPPSHADVVALLQVPGAATLILGAALDPASVRRLAQVGGELTRAAQVRLMELRAAEVACWQCGKGAGDGDGTPCPGVRCAKRCCAACLVTCGDCGIGMCSECLPFDCHHDWAKSCGKTLCEDCATHSGPGQPRCEGTHDAWGLCEECYVEFECQHCDQRGGCID